MAKTNYTATNSDSDVESHSGIYSIAKHIRHDMGLDDFSTAQCMRKFNEATDALANAIGIKYVCCPIFEYVSAYNRGITSAVVDVTFPGHNGKATVSFTKSKETFMSSEGVCLTNLNAVNQEQLSLL